VAWKHPHKTTVWSGFPSDVLLSGNRVIGVTTDEEVIALNASTGAQVMKSAPGVRRHYVGVSAAVANDVVYVGSTAGNVRAIDLHSGAEIWKRDVGAEVTTSVAIADGALIVGTQGKKVLRLRPSDGQILASLDLDVKPYDTLVVTRHGVLVRSDKSFLLVDSALKRIVWRADSKNEWTSPRPRLWHGLVVVGDNEGTVFALDEATGATKWSQKIGDKGIRGIGSDDDTLYAGTYSGKVIAFRP
jgi:outer membrane protein assembly factor BamB